MGKKHQYLYDKRKKMERRQKTQMPNALKGMPLRLYPLQPEDQAHLDSIKEIDV